MGVGNTITFDSAYPDLQESYKIVRHGRYPGIYLSFELGSGSVGTGRLDYIVYTTKDSFLPDSTRPAFLRRLQSP